MDYYVWCVLGILCFLHIPCLCEEFFNTTPRPIYSNFSCVGRAMGFYADIEANCRIYHTCDDQGNKFTYNCPEETAFRQEAMICDHAHLVDCQRGRRVLKITESHEDRTTAKSLFDKTGPNRNSQFPSFKEYTTPVPARSFRITQKPFTMNTTQKYMNNKKPVYILGTGITNGRYQDTKTSFNRQNNQVSNPVTKPITGIVNCNEKIERCNSYNANGEIASTRPVTQGSNIKQGFFNNFPGFSNFFDRLDNTKTNRASASSFARRTLTTPRTVFNSNQDNSHIRELSRTFQLTLTPRPLPYMSKSPFTFHNMNYPYSETLRSIQNHTQAFSLTSTTTPLPLIHTDLPVDSLTASLKPLIPNELEFDPYYPRIPVTTEAYYTPSDDNKRPKLFQFSTQSPLLNVQFDIPANLPDLNSLEDLIDRRKLFYIPRRKLR
ncbi:uncharacterized protein LOC107268685 isoform X2 [Cephus cinctus]|uniref:Uncharacterized protein LOC107268685 isoform X2 n=1 Tax=Cephus cinctus TaxID=211228 RepID=A0AAJ7BY77_CEPCN|nr:uncharacterized protein LOC107268685 isoform X2 [Cephus cinctus]